MFFRVLLLFYCFFSLSSSTSYLFGCGYGSQVTDETIIRELGDLTVGMGATATGCQCSWSDIQSSENATYNFTICDNGFNEQIKRGLECFSYSGFTPCFAMNQTIVNKYGCSVGYRFPPTDNYTQQFMDAYTAIAKRYNNIISYWEFGNEPNGCGWTNDNCANSQNYQSYTIWLKKWYTAMKQGSNNSILSIGGLDYNDYNNNDPSINNASKYLEGIYRSGGGNYFDAVAIHPYSTVEINYIGIQNTYSVLCANNNSYKPIWINEYGWNINNDNLKSQYLNNTLNNLVYSGNYSYVKQASYLQIQDLPNSVWGLVDVDYTTETVTPRGSWYTFEEFPKE